MATGTDLRSASAVADLFERAAQAMRRAPGRRGCIVRLPATGRLLATGDLHDNPIHFDAIVRLARLDQSPDHHVVLHELIHGDKLINGLDFSYRMLARVAELITARPDQAHVVLANHELSQLTGRGVSKGGGDSVALFSQALEYAFGDEAAGVAQAIRGFLRALPLAVIGGPPGSTVLCAHSLPAAMMMKRFDPAVLERELREEDYLGPAGPAYLMVWGRDHQPAQIDELAARWGVKLFCLGHERVDDGITMHGPRVIVLNSDHERATVLPIDLSRIPAAEEAMMLGVKLRAVGGS